MSGFSLATLYLPEWAVPWVAVFAVAAWIVGARALATAAVVVLLAEFFLAPLLEPWIVMAPLWLLFLLMGVVALTVEYDVIALIFNRKIADQIVADQLSWLGKSVFLAPFRLLGFLLRLFWRRT